MTFTPHELVNHGMTGGSNQQGGDSGSLAALFSNLAVPAGLFYAQQTLPLGESSNVRTAPSKTSVVPASLFDNLAKLAETKPTKPTKHETKKRKGKKTNNKQRKTRRV